MPKPMPKEKRSDYVSRAVQTIKGEDPKMPMDAVLGKAYGMWNTYGPGSGKGGKKARMKA